MHLNPLAKPTIRIKMGKFFPEFTREAGIGPMSDKLEDFVDGLQNQIFEETKALYGDVAFERWLHPKHMGAIDNPDGYARITGSCGDTMEIFLRFENGKVKGATFQTNGCGPSIVCASFAAELAMGKNPDELVEISGEKILQTMGGLPEESRHCAFLAAETLQAALGKYMIQQTRKKY